MARRRFSISLIVISALAALALAPGQAYAAKKDILDKGKKAQTQRQAASQRAAALGLKPGVAGVTAFKAVDPAPRPRGSGRDSALLRALRQLGVQSDADEVNPLVSRSITPGTGYTAPVVTITDVYGTGTATAAVTALDATGGITAITVDPGSAGYHVPFVTITDPTGTGATATATLDTTVTGGIVKFVDRLPTPRTVGCEQPRPVHLGRRPRNRQARRPIQVPTTTRSASSSSTSRCTPDLPPTRQRGYVQLGTAEGLLAHIPADVSQTAAAITYARDDDPDHALSTAPHFLGPTIVGTSNRAGAHQVLQPPADRRACRGDLFIPTDTRSWVRAWPDR